MGTIMVGGYHCNGDSLHPVFGAERFSLAESSAFILQTRINWECGHGPESPSLSSEHSFP